MDDGSIASGFGDLINGNEKKLRKSCFGFEVREKIYEFRYEIDEDGSDHGLLSRSTLIG